MGIIVELKFVNSDYKSKEQIIGCEESSVAPIMAWYGAYSAGDRYAVYVNGVKVLKGLNGELLPPPSG